MLLGELCRRLDVLPRHAKYVLEEGFVPPGADHEPGTGNHRDLSPAQAFWMGIVLLLKKTGLRTELAARIAAHSLEAVRSVARSLGWDPAFNPIVGKLKTRNRWIVEVGDLKCIRLLTDTNPSGDGELESLAWKELATLRDAKEFSPLVAIQMDLARIAGLLVAE